MIEGSKTAVVIPAYNEEKLLPPTLDGIPSFVDRIFVVDDASKDGTVGKAHAAAELDSRVTVIVHERNRGAGAAVVTGYQRALADAVDRPRRHVTNASRPHVQVHEHVVRVAVPRIDIVEVQQLEHAPVDRRVPRL